MPICSAQLTAQTDGWRNKPTSSSQEWRTSKFEVRQKFQLMFKPELLTHGDADFLGQVVAHALKIPGWISGLNVPSGVGGAARKYVLAGRGFPLYAPSGPGEQAGRFPKRRIDPVVVDAELNA